MEEEQLKAEIEFMKELRPKMDEYILHCRQSGAQPSFDEFISLMKDLNA